MRQSWPVLILGVMLLSNSAALAQPSPLGPGSPGVPPVGQTGPGDPGYPMPPMPPDAPEAPDTPASGPVPTFGDPPAVNAFEGGGKPGDAGPGFYLTAGMIALRRESVGNNAIAVFDPGINLPPFPPFFDYGPPYPNNPATALSIGDLNAKYGYGVKASLVFPGEASLFEITGYYIPRSLSTATASAPSRLDLPFAKSPPPVGFEGDNNLWLQADQVKLTLDSEIANVEMNTHYASSSTFNFLLGLRYFNLIDSFSIFTSDDGLTISPVDPTTNATYSVVSESRLLGPQVGVEMRLMIDDPDVFIGLGVTAMPAVNFSEVGIGLVRGDGFVGPSGHRVKTIYSQLLEFNLALEFGLTERICFRAGYQALVLINVPVSYDQINFDPGNTAGNVNENGIAIFHGPSLMLQF